jgi:hypothetical protein
VKQQGRCERLKRRALRPHTRSGTASTAPEALRARLEAGGAASARAQRKACGVCSRRLLRCCGGRGAPVGPREACHHGCDVAALDADAARRSRFASRPGRKRAVSTKSDNAALQRLCGRNDRHAPRTHPRRAHRRPARRTGAPAGLPGSGQRRCGATSCKQRRRSWAKRGAADEPRDPATRPAGTGRCLVHSAAISASGAPKFPQKAGA